MRWAKFYQYTTSICYSSSRTTINKFVIFIDWKLNRKNFMSSNWKLEIVSCCRKSSQAVDLIWLTSSHYSFVFLSSTHSSLASVVVLLAHTTQNSLLTSLLTMWTHYAKNKIVNIQTRSHQTMKQSSRDFTWAAFHSPSPPLALLFTTLCLGKRKTWHDWNFEEIGSEICR